MRWPEFVEIKEVGPRDGLQNESEWVETEDKIAWINKLSETGVREIEYSSFVHPKWVPALKDAKEVGKKIKRNPNVIYSALIPNERGLENALEAGIDKASVFMSASETHNLKNINKSIDDTYPVLKPVIERAKQENKIVTGYISTVFECPYEGKIKIDDVLRVCERLFEMGVDDISLGDTIGTAVPSEVEALLDAILYRYPTKNIILHFHNTKGMAIANIVTALRYGITRFDASLGGLGGCPYAPGAAGNVSTNDLLYLLHGLGIETGIDEAKINEATDFILGKITQSVPSRSLAYFAKEEQLQKSAHKVQVKHVERIYPPAMPQRKREIIYLFLKRQLKNQYNRLRSRT